MKISPKALDDAFIERQRQRLLAIRAELVNSASAAAAEEGELRQDLTDQAHEIEDSAQTQTLLEIHGVLDDRVPVRLALVNRALEKIRDGTYGLTDLGGQRISRERLEAIPEAASALNLAVAW